MARRKKKNSKISAVIVIAVVVASGLVGGFGLNNSVKNESTTDIPTTKPVVETTKSELLEYTGEAYSVINNNEPQFIQDEITDKYFENYAPLDEYGRCGVAFACLGKETMPTEERGEIGSVKPTGWHTVKYDCVDGKYLYNRCHLIGFQLSGENAKV